MEVCYFGSTSPPPTFRLPPLLESLLQHRITREVVLLLTPWGLTLSVTTCLLLWTFWKSYSLRVNVPTIGASPGPFGGWRAMFKYFSHGSEWIAEGYDKYTPTAQTFKIPSISRYILFPTSTKILEEMMAEPDHVLSFGEALTEKLAVEWTLHPSIKYDPYHLQLIRTKLTQRLSTILPEVMDELVTAWGDGAGGDVGKEGWTRVRVWEVMVVVVARTTNRMFVGLPLCRDQEYLDNVIAYSLKVVKAGAILDILPRFLRAPLTNLLMQKSHHYALMRKHVGHIFRERKAKMQECLASGQEWKDCPDDLIQWILDFSEEEGGSSGSGKRREEEELIARILFMNFASIHTTATTVTQAIFDIAAHPELQPDLHIEITEVLSKEGMSKQSLTKMKKLDSVIRESQRLNTISTITMMRKSLIPYTFSDGTHLPTGTWIAAPATALQRSLLSIPNPAVFNGFRWERLRVEEEEAGRPGRYAAVTTSFEHLVFGHGKHACPGRFFAVNELKVLLAHVVGRFEMRCLPEQGRPKNWIFGVACRADPEGVVEFRLR
ncbi:cytochrome P450 [Choiromyces venosus 120613-1]|uniref:Cytochrome P450 n=1 Tax=Choiromyces venosus 120613-1 TaxID=1336337 RepID=A0A3N4JL58_9PEZI|nr:cytochrome P450 [Choiromyces venosus 120613-1]